MLNNLSRLYSGNIEPRREEEEGEASRVSFLLPGTGNKRKSSEHGPVGHGNLTCQ